MNLPDSEMGVVALICGWGPEDEVKYLCIIKLLKLKNHKEISQRYTETKWVKSKDILTRGQS